MKEIDELLNAIDYSYPSARGIKETMIKNKETIDHYCDQQEADLRPL